MAPLGLAIGPIRWPDSRVVAIDTLTGKVKWAVSMEEPGSHLGAPDGARAGGDQRGDGGVVVAGVAAGSADGDVVPDRADLGTGRLRWQHLLGSTGALPYRTDPYVSDSAEVRDGIVYHSDMLGVVERDGNSGRVGRCGCGGCRRWRAQTFDPLAAWQIGEPVIDGDSLIMLSPDHRQVVRLDRATGEVRGWCEASRFESRAARYILKTGSNLAVVFDNRIAVVPIATFEQSPVRVTPKIPEPGQRAA